MMQSVKTNLLAAFRYLLKPLVRLAVKNSVSFPEFSESLKQAYVDVAIAQIRAVGNDPTDEGISLITSIDRSEIMKAMGSNDGSEFSSRVQRELPLPALLTAWHTGATYTGPYGVCLDLKFDPSDKKSVDSFARLAAEACPGISPAVLLDELLRTGSVQSVGNNYYRPIKRSYVPDPLSVQSILLFAQVVHNLCESAERNLRAESAGGKGLMQRIVFTNHGVTAKDLQDFDGYIRSRGQIFADDIDNWLSDRDREGDGNRVNTGVGFYQYIVNDEDEIALSKKLQN
jgi:hypothetical protein